VNTPPALSGWGVSLLMVEQRAREAMSISDRAYVMAGGRVVITGRAAVLGESAHRARSPQRRRVPRLGERRLGC
jgi:ABC-type branched-subunit amino acid transport system ATPase component